MCRAFRWLIVCANQTDGFQHADDGRVIGVPESPAFQKVLIELLWLRLLRDQLQYLTQRARLVRVREPRLTFPLPAALLAVFSIVLTFAMRSLHFWYGVSFAFILLFDRSTG